MDFERTPLSGLHHMTAICGDAQANVDFFTGVLGLRMIKLTVNFDDPSAYHTYYGDGVGSPGSALTYFPYPGGRRYQPGNGQFSRTVLGIPLGSIEYWEARLRREGIETAILESEFGEPTIHLSDPDGGALGLVESEVAPEVLWQASPVPAENAISGMRSVRLSSRSSSSATFIEGRLGLRLVQESGGVKRYAIGDKAFLELERLDHDGWGGHGGVHHLALATEDENAQVDWRTSLVEAGAHVSPVMDRDYFRSIYFREPGGALYEIATKGPGFTIDETVELLGTSLRLPKQYEPAREQILNVVPRLKLPSGVVIGV